MGDEHRRVQLRDLCDSIDYGLTASATDVPLGPRFLRITDIVQGALNWSTVPYVAASESDSAKYRLRPGDVVVARTGATTGYSACVLHPPESLFASYLVRFSVSKQHDPRFVGYLLKGPQWWEYIHGVLGDKSAQPNASASTLADAWLDVPPLSEQRAIAEVLGALDDKIEANNSILRIVKETSQAIWRKHSLRSRSVPLSQVVQVGLSGVWGQQSRTPGATVEVLCLRGRDLEDLVDRVQSAPPRRWLSSKQTQSRLSTGPEIWTAGSGSLGPTLLLTEGLRKASALPLLYSNFVKRLVPLSGMERHLPSAWFALLDSWQSGEFSSFTTGTAMPNLDATAMLAMVIVPLLDDVAIDEVAAWAELALDPTLLGENQKLAALRDALLPKLLSGELRVRDADELLGEVV